MDMGAEMIGYTINNRNRYKCKYCDHPTYKTHGGVILHVNEKHSHEYQLELKDLEIERLKNQKPRVEYKERVVYRDKPETEQKYWDVSGVYCPSCKVVNVNVGIPVGQTIENTPHNPCKNRGLMLVREVHGR
jgi:hypothetical protein